MQKIEINRPPLSLPPTLSALLPHRLTDALRRSTAPRVEELRLHANREATVTAAGRSFPLGVTLGADEMQTLLQGMCAGSLYAHSETIRQGYLSLPDGIRVGVCGTAATDAGQVIGVREITGLTVRIPHRTEVDASPILRALSEDGSMRGALIFAPPGVGKTTLLRAIAALASSPCHAIRTVAVDTRAELRFGLDAQDLLLDILVGYPRALGIEIAVRSLGAQLIVCDEIGSAEDADAILSAANCGVPLVASTHARSLGELLDRPAIATLHRAGVFDLYVSLSRVGNRFSYEISRRCDVSGGIA